MSINKTHHSMATTHGAGKDELQSTAHEAMLARGLLPDFSPAAMAQTNHITQAAVASGPTIRDLRGLLWAQIDNDASRDLDQLPVAEPVADGAVKVLVAIADVGVLVRNDSAIDGHAWTNTTAVSTAAEIFPMLPEKLSTSLTSLGEGQERLANVVGMVIAADGTVITSDIYQAIVLNRAKLAYSSIAAWLEGTPAAPHQATRNSVVSQSRMKAQPAGPGLPASSRVTRTRSSRAVGPRLGCRAKICSIRSRPLRAFALSPVINVASASVPSIRASVRLNFGSTADSNRATARWA
jgi:hypothetical protein